MVWQHKSRGHWFCTDIKPLEIEVKILSSGSVAWQVKNEAGVFFRDKAASPRIAMECAAIHAIEVAKHFKTPIVEQF